MDERGALLGRWGLSPTLVRLVAGDLPHPLFETVCEAIQPHHTVPTWTSVEYDARDRDRPRVGVPLWGRELGRARYYEVVYGVRSPDARVEFWWVPCSIYNDREPRLIAWSEQGLYFWLFAALLDARGIPAGGAADASYREAAEAVGFRYLPDLFRFRAAEDWSGGALDEERLRHRAALIEAEPVAAHGPGRPL